MSTLHLHNHQSEVRIPLKKLTTWLRRALKHLPRGTPLPEEVEITFISNDEMCRVHEEFMDDSSPTDVITFHHGEILICPRVAREVAPEHHHTTEHELFFYAVHGLLHLLGWDDRTAKERQRMHTEQKRIIDLVLNSGTP